MKNDQFVSSSLVVKEYLDFTIQDDLFSTQDKTIAQLIEENDEKTKNQQEAQIVNSG
jgi:hypothetical protein